jgi:multidrug resistance protein
MGKLIVLFVTAFVDMVGTAMILPLLPYYAQTFGVNAATVGILVSAFSLSQLACAPLWGRMSDRFGRRPAILAGLAITAVAYVLFGLAESVGALLLSRIVQGLGGGTIGVVQAYVADASPPDERTKSMGWLSAVTSFGAVVGPAFGSVTVSIGGRAGPGFAAAGLALIVAVFAWRYLRESLTATITAEHPTVRTHTSRTAFTAMFTQRSDPATRLIWIYAVAIGAFYGTVPTMPLLFSDRLGITEQTIGYVIVYLGGMGVIVRALILGRAVDRLGEERLSRLGIVLLSIGLALVGATTNYPTLVLALTLMPLGTAFLFPCLSGQLSRIVSRRERGFYMGIQHMFGGASRVAFPIGAGIAMDQLGLGVPFFVAAGLVIALLPLTRIPSAAQPHGPERDAARAPARQSLEAFRQSPAQTLG